jgi:hypothetical protein
MSNNCIYEIHRYRPSNKFNHLLILTRLTPHTLRSCDLHIQELGDTNALGKYNTNEVRTISTAGESISGWMSEFRSVPSRSTHYVSLAAISSLVHTQTSLILSSKLQAG